MRSCAIGISFSTSLVPTLPTENSNNKFSNRTFSSKHSANYRELSFFPIFRARFRTSTKSISRSHNYWNESILCQRKSIHSTPHEHLQTLSDFSRSPYDLVHFARSRFVAQLNELRRRNALPPGAVPDDPSHLEKVLRDAGITHEKRVVQNLVSLLEKTCTDPLYVVPRKHPDRFELTKQAMRDRVPLIQGAALQSPQKELSGYSDLLILSSVDPFLSSAQRGRADPRGYAVCEVKLSSTQSNDHTLQLASYAAMLQRLQSDEGVEPVTHSYLWLGNPDSPPESLQVRTLKYLFMKAWKEYKEFLQEFEVNVPLQIPDAPLNTLAPWRNYAKQLLERKDSLYLISGIRRSQVKEISDATGVETLTEFANLDVRNVEQLVRDTKLPNASLQLHHQAYLQLRTRRVSKPVFQLKKIFRLKQPLPFPSKLDVFFDLEGYPFMQNGGLEYLFGASYESKNFRYWFGHNREEEEKSFVAFIKWLKSLQEQAKEESDVIPHVYHYGDYEIQALQRIAKRVTTKEGHLAVRILETLMEDDIFFDVYKFVKSVLVIGESSYSIKKVEKLVNISREGDELADAESSVAMYYDWRKSYYEGQDNHHKLQANMNHPILDEILSYNRQDCESLQDILNWLRKRVTSSLPPLSDISSDLSSESDSEKQEEIHRKRFLPGTCGRTESLKTEDSDSIQRSNELSDTFLQNKIKVYEDESTQTLSHFLQFYVRESAPIRRVFRERVTTAASSDTESLVSVDKCISGAQYSHSEKSPNGKKTYYVYRFPSSQPISFTEGEGVALVTTNLASGILGEQSDIACFMSVKRLEKHKNPSYLNVVLSAGRRTQFRPPLRGTFISTDDFQVCDAPLRQSILRKAEVVAKDSKDILETLPMTFLNREPFFKDQDELKDVVTISNDSTNLANLLQSKDSSFVFVIQGPPGSGKTRLSAGIIYELIKTHKKTVAVTSNSHAAIDNLLKATVNAGLEPSLICKVGTRLEDESVKVSYGSNLAKLNIGATSSENFDNIQNEDIRLKERQQKDEQNQIALVGATCYQLCKQENVKKFDYLFVDEASQVTAANFLAESSCAKAAVLVGDQQQLQMPIRGAHPGSAGLSCLSYSVGVDSAIVPANRGIFLGESYRMNPQLCNFVSSTFYDNALKPASICEENAISVPDNVNDCIVKAGKGIIFVGCSEMITDETNFESGTFGKWYRPEEVQTVIKIILELLNRVVNIRGEIRELQCEDIMVVAPYNAQVRALKANVPEGVRVGTVDKFQGQEAPVSIISTCTGLHNDSDMPSEMFLEDISKSQYNLNDVEPVQGSNHKGVRFALQKNRLNVAMSRAQCLAIIVGHEDAFAGLPLSKYEDADTCSLYELIKTEGQWKDTTEDDLWF